MAVSFREKGCGFSLCKTLKRVYSMKFGKWVLMGLMSLVGAFPVRGQGNVSALLPLPNSIEQQTGFFQPERVVRAACSGMGGETYCRSRLQEIFRQRLGCEVQWAELSAARPAELQMAVDPTLKGREHYVLEVTPKGVSLVGATEAAVVVGLQTLDQLLLGDACQTAAGRMACVRIDDQPRFAFRALMLDPARHFLPVDDVKRYIDQMVRYKYNVLQLHLSDDQGWRVEIRKYPQLTEKGAFRRQGAGAQGPDNGFYTQDELRDLVDYAAQRNVEIVPEIDMPGHTVALLTAFPELKCEVADTAQWVLGKTDNKMLCAACDRTYEVCKDILAELADIFPSSRVHLGGDEAALAKNWAVCPRCRKLMEEKGFTEVAQLMGYFFANILPSVREKGKTPVLWCELDNLWMPAHEYLFPYPQDVTLITWRNGLTPKCMELTAQSGNPLIMAPGEYTYFDYPQWKGDLPEFNNWGMPVTPLKKVYEFDPEYGWDPKDLPRIEGVMGTLWGEAIKDVHRATYMTYPRGLALAEAGWTQMEHRSWGSFQQRMLPNLMNLMREGVSFRVPYEVFNNIIR